MEKLRLAIIGSGPAGIYAADLMLKAERDFDVSIDLYEQLPAPYGLVRYGVAPDHPRIKGIVTALRAVLDCGDIRLFANVRYGTDITLADLKKHYNAVIFATGAVQDADLHIPGIDFDGSYGAGEFVSWYDGHPDVPWEWPLAAHAAAVIGNGNVALDVARILAKHVDDLLPTEIPPNVYDGLAASPITDVHIFGRRGPMQVKFTPLELRELGEVPDVDIVLDEADFHLDEVSQNAIDTNKQVLVISRIMNKWRERETGQASRRIHLHFYSRPVEVVGAVPDSGVGEPGPTLPDPNDASASGGRAVESEGLDSSSPAHATPRVTAFRYERMVPDGEGGVTGTGEIRELPVQAVYRAVGYFGSPLDGIPFNVARGVIPNFEGQVLDEHNEQLHGVYATGWIKRGPTGLIGHTKSDAMETIKHVLNDQASWWSPEHPDEGSVSQLLMSRGVRYTTIDGWHELDQHELTLGSAEGRVRIKVVPRDEMVEISSNRARER